MKLKHSHQKLFLLSSAILFIASYFLIFQKGLKVNPTMTKESSGKMTGQSQIKNIYTSEFLGFEFEVPGGFEVRESGNTIFLSKSKSTLTITRLIGYSNTEKEYMDLAAELNQYEYAMNVTNINSFYEVTTNIESETIDGEKSYLKRIAENTFVSISTSSPELYDELQEVAASFRYLGDP